MNLVEVGKDHFEINVYLQLLRFQSNVFFFLTRWLLMKRHMLGALAQVSPFPKCLKFFGRLPLKQIPGVKGSCPWQMPTQKLWKLWAHPRSGMWLGLEDRFSTHILALICSLSTLPVMHGKTRQGLISLRQFVPHKPIYPLHQAFVKLF